MEKFIDDVRSSGESIDASIGGDVDRNCTSESLSVGIDESCEVKDDDVEGAGPEIDEGKKGEQIEDEEEVKKEEVDST